MANEIRLLRRITVNETRMINFLLVGQSENQRNFTGFIEEKTGQEVSFSFSLKPLSRSGTQKYIEYRLKKAGADKRIFDQESIDEIYLFSAGYQRVINMVCDHALLSGYSEGLFEIRKSTILNCIEELRQRGVQ